ncbi:MAG: c-type cytochrome [Gammaproteobacteria bacterium]|nr:c-type cytochrome [Gammaproteobacteria bacterium]
MSSEPEMSDGQFTNLFSIMIGGLIVLTIALIILAVFVSSGVNQSNLNDQARESQTAERIAPAGRINVGDAASTQSASPSGGDTGSAEVASGEDVYQNNCAACHASGVAGAPVFGDEGAWSERLAQGMETLYRHSIEGFQGSAGVMPAKGGNTSLSDEAVKAAVDHMVDAVSEAAESEAAESEAAESEAAESEAAESEAAESEAAESEAAESEAAESEAAESEAAESEAAETEAAETEAAESDVAAGKTVYESSCVACHASGVAGAPRLGEADAWSERIAQGMETLYRHSIEGFQGDSGMMPPKGGNTSLSDDEVKAAVDYMVQQAE